LVSELINLSWKNILNDCRFYGIFRHLIAISGHSKASALQEKTEQMGEPIDAAARWQAGRAG